MNMLKFAIMTENSRLHVTCRPLITEGVIALNRTKPSSSIISSYSIKVVIYNCHSMVGSGLREGSCQNNTNFISIKKITELSMIYPYSLMFFMHNGF